MISSIFGKTKPINYIIILTFLFVFYWFTYFSLYSLPYKTDYLLHQIVALGALLFMVFIINFIAKRNKITAIHSYTIFFFALLIVLFPEVLLDNNNILCSFFLLLAIRRLLSIKSLKKIKIKLFDATLWVVISSLFYDWAILFLILVCVTIYLYEPKNIRNWMVPFIGVATTLSIVLGVQTMLNQHQFLETHYNFSVGITKDYLLEWRNSLKLLLYILGSLVLIVVTFLKLSKSGQGRINTMRLVTVFFFIGIVITLLKASNTIAPILITFFSASVFMSNYIETIKKPNIKELVLIATLIIPFLLLVAKFI